MKILLIGWLFFLILVPASLSASVVTFKITGLRSNQGTIWVGMYQNEKSFLKEEGQVGNCKQVGEISNGMAQVVCTIEPGVYGAAAYHDENNNSKFDTNILGIPKEGYSFPNNIKTRLKLPDFKDVLIHIGKSDIEMKLEFQYF